MTCQNSLQDISLQLPVKSTYVTTDEVGKQVFLILKTFTFQFY